MKPTSTSQFTNKPNIAVRTLLCLLFPLFSYGQQSQLDSLLSILPDQAEDEQKIEILHSIGLQYTRSDLKKAKTYFLKAMELSNTLSNNELLSSCYKILGVVYVMESNLDSSWYYYDMANRNYIKYMKNLSEKDRPWVLEGHLSNLGNMANWYYYKGQLDSSTYHHEQVIELCDQYEREGTTGIEGIRANSLDVLGSLYSMQGNNDKSLETYRKTLKLFEKTNDVIGQARVYQKIGHWYTTYSNDYEESLIYFRKAYRLKKDQENPRSLAWSQTYLANAFVHVTQFDSVEYYLNECREFVKNSADIPLINMFYHTEANLFYQNNASLEKIEAACFKILENAKGSSSSLDLTPPYKILASANFRVGRYKEAIQYGEKTIELNQQNGDLNSMSTVQKVVYDSYKALDSDPRKTLEAYQNYLASRDSLLAQEKVEKIESLQIQYETEKKEQLIAAQKEKLNRQRMIQILSIGLATLFALLLFLSIKNARIRKQTNEKLKELDTLKNRLYTNITHEFRTPLTVITGMATQIKDNPKEWLDEGLTMIKRNGNILLDLVNQMLDLSKLESGKIQLNNQQGDIVSFLKYMVESLHSFAESKKIQIHFRAENEEIIVDFDPEKIQRIMINLLSNAIKFTPENGHIYVNASILKTLAKNAPEMLQLNIRDTGMGIAEDQLPFIFDRFYQVDTSTTRSTSGSGIGLAMVRELIHLMGGEIDVKSRLGKETEFKLLLPISNIAPKTQDNLLNSPMKNIGFPFSKSDQRHDSKLGEIDQVDDSKPRVLIIEDNPDVVAYMVSCLKDQFSTQVGTNGQAGIDMAVDMIPDLIITDVMMPAKDGFEVTKFLKSDERTSHIPIIMLTAKADVASKLEGLKRGADAYLAKPFDQEELKIRMNQLILMRHKLAARYATNHISTLPPTQDEDIKIEDAFLIKINGFIHAELHNSQYGVGDLIADAGMSRSQLYRKLKALTNRSIVAYIRLIRLQKSLELLSHTDKNISEVAYDVGFADPAYFSRAFNQEFGKSPIQYLADKK